MPNPIDLTGQRSGKLVAVHSVEGDRNQKRAWLCDCDCGGTVTVATQLFREKRVQSCGCLNRQPITGSTTYIHGHARRGLVTPTHHTWANMLRRCNDPSNKNYHQYGGRGISVCERWLIFENFLSDMGERPAGLTLDRTENDGNYEPGNCKWITHYEQMQNTRVVRRITFNGETLRLHEWAKRLNIGVERLRRRLRELPLDEAMIIPKPIEIKPKLCLVCEKLVNVSRDGLLWWHRNGRGSVCSGYHQQFTIDTNAPLGTI